MNGPFAKSIALAVTLWGGCAAALAQPADVAEQRAILLDNGHVLRGQVIDEGDQVSIRLGPGSQIRLPRVRIRAMGRSLDELAAAQHRQLHRNDVRGRIDLVHWCLRNDLPSRAGAVLVELVALAPDDRQVALLERQVRESLQRRDANESAAADNDGAPAKRAAAPRVWPVMRRRPEKIEEISAEELVEFTHHVQPILINHCSAAGCHGVVSQSDFQLLRPFSGGRLTQRMTSSNLQAALAYVDRHAPLKSPLLSAATQPHAGRKTPIIQGPRGRQSLEALEQWLDSLGKDKRPDSATTSPSNAGGSEKVLNSPSPPPAAFPRNSRVDQNVSAGPNQNLAQRVTPGANRGLHPTANETANKAPGAANPAANPAPSAGPHSPLDPFDPDAFNRRYHPERFEFHDPFGKRDQPPPGQTPSTSNSPASSASRNARLLESRPERPRTAAGGSH